MPQQDHIRHHIGSVRPYLYGNLDLIDLVKQAFNGEELERVESSGGFHVEMIVGDSVLVLEVGDFPLSVSPTRASIYVYVPDVDAAYQRALAAGARSVAAPEDKPYQERSAGIKDTFGNIWYISTFKG